LAEDAKLLKQLLIESRTKLAPLEDPFDIDLGLHRWLSADREEAYSDWLEWVIRNTASPEEVFDLFGLPKPPPEVIACRKFEVRRELCVPHGHESQEGRLDLVIRFGDKAIIVVEVKKGDADCADTIKHGGYGQWLADQNYPLKHAILLATDAEDEDYSDFTFISWSRVCIGMRRLAVHHCKKHRMVTAAMTLAFVAAVEQNLLGFSAGVVKEVCKGSTVLFNPMVVAHLERFVAAGEV
jgi:hypothetical protein